MASTNRPDIVDSAFLRPGRFDRLLYVTAPDADSRRQILKVHTKDMPLADDVSLNKIAETTEGYSGADLENLCREAGMEAIREKKNDLEKIEYRHFEAALEKINSTLPREIIEQYDVITKQLMRTRNIRESKEDLYR